jgi:hypothetical protein
METSAEVTALLQRAIDALDHSGPAAAIELLGSCDPLVAADAYARLQSELYWKRKNLPAMVALSQAGIEHALAAAERCADTSQQQSFRQRAKRLAYNLASFTWPGWNEPGIDLAAKDLAAGLWAAELNVHLATVLQRPPADQAGALWVLGAQRLAAADHAGALTTFQQALSHALLASDPTLEGMLRGYESLTHLLARSDDPPLQERFEAHVAALRSLSSPDAVSYAEQLLVARDVFVPRQFARREMR